MAVKIRLQRHGRKARPFYHLVVADARAPRDGRFIERIGSYNPNTNPATIEVDLQKAVQWLDNGAQPTDTARAILSYRGVLHRRYLDKGVKKGVLTQEQADAKFATWMAAKEAKIDSKIAKLSGIKVSEKERAFAHEAKVRAEREAALIAKRTPAEEVKEDNTEAAADESSTEA